MLSKKEIQEILVDIKADGMPDFQQKVEKTTARMGELREQIREVKEGLSILRAKGQEGSESFVTLEKQSKDLDKELKTLTVDQKGYTNALNINQMSAKQLAERSSVLKGTLDSMPKSLYPEKWEKLNQEYIKVTKRLQEVKVGTIKVSDSMKISGMSANQLAAYSKQLTTRMNDIPKAADSPKWQKLNARLQDVRKRQKDLYTESSGITKKSITASTILGNLWTKAIGIGINGLKKFGKDAITQTQTIGDAWAHMTAGMTAGWNQFVVALSTKNMDHFFSRIKEAYDVAEEVAGLMDELFEMKNSLSISETNANIEIKQLEVILKNVNEPDKKRIEAGERILEIENEIRVQKQQIAAQEMEAQKKLLQQRTQMSDEDMKFFIEDYMKNRQAITQGLEIQKAEKKIENLRNAPGGQSGTQWQYHQADIKKAEQELETLKAKYGETATYAFEVIKKYDLANDEMVTNYVNALNEYNQADYEYSMNTMRTQTRMNALKKSLSDEDLKKIEGKYKAETEKAEQTSNKRTNIIKEEYASGKLSKTEYDSKIRSEEEKLIRDKMAINILYGKDYSELQGKIYDNQIAYMEEMKKAIADGNKGLLDELKKDSLKFTEDLLAEADKAVEELMNDIGSEEMDKFQELMKKRQEVTEKFGEVDEKKAAADVSFKAEEAQLQELLDKKMISEEAFQNAKTELIKKHAQENAEIETAGWTDGLSTAQEYLNQVSNVVSSVKEAQMATLDAQMQAELSAAGDNSEKREAIEERYEQKKLELQKKYANIEMGINIAKAIAAGALASIQAWTAAAGNPILAGTFIALIAASTAAEVATMIAQRNAIVNTSSPTSSSGGSTPSVRSVSGGGFSEGGYTGTGGRLEPAGIVHRGEYVVPQPEMRNPSVLARVHEIESIRTQRTRANRLSGYADGGMVTTPSATATDALIKENIALLKSLRDNPIKAYTLLSDSNAAQELNNRFKQAVGR